MSSTVAKAVSLLEHFTEDTPELGLSELARQSAIDKAAVYRMMGALAEAGIVEQNRDTRMYRLGAGVLRLARVRETAFPIHSVVQPILDGLVAQTGETAHASLISGRALANIATSESHKSNRVSLEAGEVLPLHSTASGQATLAFAEDALLGRALSQPLEARTRFTVTDGAELAKLLDRVRQQGFAISDQANEEDVNGIAAPVFDASGFAAGAVSVSTPSHRMTESHRALAISAVVRAAGQVTAETGGTVPRAYQRLVAPLMQLD